MDNATEPQTVITTQERNLHFLSAIAFHHENKRRQEDLDNRIKCLHQQFRQTAPEYFQTCFPFSSDVLGEVITTGSHTAICYLESFRAGDEGENDPRTLERLQKIAQETSEAWNNMIKVEVTVRSAPPQKSIDIFYINIVAILDDQE